MVNKNVSFHSDLNSLILDNNKIINQIHKKDLYICLKLNICVKLLLLY